MPLRSGWQYHDDAVRNADARRPEGAGGLIQALEDARVEAVGTENYPGAASNIEAALRQEAQAAKAGYGDAQGRCSFKRGAAISSPRSLYRPRYACGKRSNSPGSGSPGLRSIWAMRRWRILKAVLHDQAAFARLAHQLIDNTGNAEHTGQAAARNILVDNEDNKKEQGSERDR